MVYIVNPFAFRINDSKELSLTWIMSFVILVVFPLVTTFLMRGLKLISSLEMVDPKERIGPMIGTIVFYVWYFVNIKDNPVYPVALSIVALGGTISLCLAFFINNFSKISLHTIGAGSFVAGLILLLFNFSAPRLIIPFFQFGRVEVMPVFLIAISVFIAGLIGSSRLILEAHEKSDLYGGYLVGIISQVIAFKILY